MRILIGLIVLSCIASTAAGLHPDHHPWRPEIELPRTDPFARLDDEVLPSPNRFRTASGAPGPDYWQQQADYRIDARLDTQTHSIIGQETITYYNNSPDTLDYLWVQLDQNRFKADSKGKMSQRAPNISGGMSFDDLRSHLEKEKFPGGFNISAVVDGQGNPLPHVVTGTMMRIDLPEPLEPDEQFVFSIDWTHRIVPTNKFGARSGFELFDDGRSLYGLAQWFPRMAAYTDYDGWQTRPFLGRGEFTLEFGDYDVSLTVPENHIVASTGELQNPEDVLNQTERERLEEAAASDRPVMIVTREDADAKCNREADGMRTWRFTAKNVRDFAWASSPDFAWDAMAVQVEGNDENIMCMSYWPREADLLWDKYSTHAVAHGIEQYSKHVFPYPWPVAISVNGVVGGGMEYPMITFNGPRPEEDGTYSQRTKYGLISVIIHEVGHFWFPMIINSDERQWTWMDEGLNTYVQFLAEREWEEDYARERGLPRDITGYMSSPNQRPIMTTSESILQFGPNAYAKPATALNILRETVVGRELFDHAFKTYSRRWAFKRPEPADFFRSIEDASGEDLDWFWRGWFYTTQPVDLKLSGVETWRVHSEKPEVENEVDREEESLDEPTPITATRNEGINRRTDRYPELIDFYNTYDEHAVTPADKRARERLLEQIKEEDEALLDTKDYFHILRFSSNGAQVMPIPLLIEYEDGSTEELTLPADLWRSDHRNTSTMLIRPLAITRVTLDPHDEIADIDRSDNTYPPLVDSSRFRLRPDWSGTNPMREARIENARAETEQTAQAWATEVAQGSGIPGSTPESPEDGWGNPMMLVMLPASDDPKAPIARIMSNGPDGAAGTLDDLSAEVSPDGSLDPLRTAEERVAP
ncbi:MAG: aminopeptidase [Phycisphaerae bacterium]|nr:aminopeptidase [Phycisphaerae bacterium]